MRTFLKAREQSADRRTQIQYRPTDAGRCSRAQNSPKHYRSLGGLVRFEQSHGSRMANPSAASEQPLPAKSLIDFLTAPAAARVYQANGMDPAGARNAE